MEDELKQKMKIMRCYNLPESFASTITIKSEGLIFRAFDNLNKVVIVGCLRPRSNSEMYVRSRSQNSASFSCERLFFSRNSLKTVPNMPTIILSDFSQHKNLS